jgi:23S rRNA pseudouridine1911/1915/1917 synthase
MHTEQAMSEAVTVWLVGDEESGERLDRFVVARAPQFSRVVVQRLIEGGQILVNHVPAKASYRLEAGDHVTAELPAAPAPAEAPPAPEPEITLHVVYEDTALAVIDKPAGLVVHPAHGHETGTLLNALLARYPELRNWPGEGWPGLVHRLDRETSGLLLVARTPEVQETLRAQWKAHGVRKVYVALVIGAPQLDRARIDSPIARDPHQRQRMAVVSEGGREAVTEYRVLERLGNYTLLEAYPETGRTHQIRVHLAAIGHPVVGDHLYGPRRQRLDPGRHFLHAARLTFRHPTSGEEMTFSVPLPAELEEVLGELRKRKT